MGIAVDAAGDAYVTGDTSSADFPTRNPFQATTSAAGDDAFVTELTPGGSSLVYSTYLGGSCSDVGSGIAVDAAGGGLRHGVTSSADFPTRDPFQAAGARRRRSLRDEAGPGGQAWPIPPTSAATGGERGRGRRRGGRLRHRRRRLDPAQEPDPGEPPRQQDAFVTEFNPAGSALVFSTYLGGNNYDDGAGIALDALGDIDVAGTTLSPDFPTVHPIQATFGGDLDAFVAQISPLAPPAFTTTWTGAVSNLWSNPGNWTNGIPAAGARLIFPAGAAHLTNTNDLGSYRARSAAVRHPCSPATATHRTAIACGFAARVVDDAPAGGREHARAAAGRGGRRVRGRRGTLILDAPAANTYTGPTIVTTATRPRRHRRRRRPRPARHRPARRRRPPWSASERDDQIADSAAVTLTGAGQLLPRQLLGHHRLAGLQAGVGHRVDDRHRRPDAGRRHHRDARRGGPIPQIFGNLALHRRQPRHRRGPGAGSFDLEIVGQISGAGGLTLTGGGMLELSGAVANTYAGTTTVAAGTLVLNQRLGLAIPGPLVIGQPGGRRPGDRPARRRGRSATPPRSPSAATAPWTSAA